MRMKKRKIDNAFIGMWTEEADSWLAERGLMRSDVKTGSEAWRIAGYTEMLTPLYRSNPRVSDGEIQAGLQLVFPNAVFKNENLI